VASVVAARSSATVAVEQAVLSSASGVVQANLDDLMNSRAGGIMREYVPNAIRNEEIPFVAKESFPMLEYIDHQKETRTGQTRYSQGTDADSLNKTARGIQMIQQAGQQRGDLILVWNSIRSRPSKENRFG